MEKIQLEKIVPHVFSHVPDLQSDIWNKNVTLEKNNVYLIEAHSGKGKSTLCSYLIGYRQDYSGSLLFDSRPATEFNLSDWTAVRRENISYLFQELRLFPELTALDNVLIKNSLTNHLSVDQIDEWFDLLGIAEKRNVLVGNMSFGQQQRVAMMRALAQPFDFLIADEPISHLDDANAAIMATLMIEEARKQGAGVIVTSIGKHMDLPYDKVLCL